MNTNLIKYLELFAGITGMVCYFKYKKSVWFVFSIYLIILFCFEYVGYRLGVNKMYKANTILYKTLVIPSIFLMYHWVFSKILPSKSKKLIGFSAIFFVLFAILENTFLGKEHFYSISISLSYGCLAVLFFSLQYFLNLLKSDELLVYYKVMAFWFCVGLLIFYLGSFCKLSLFNSLAFSKNKELVQAFNWVFVLLNYIMYSLFAIGFICSKPK